MNPQIMTDPGVVDGAEGPPGGSVATPKRANDSLSRLIEESRAGSPWAFAGLVRLCQDFLLGMAEREMPAVLRAKMGPSDLVQETWLEAQRHIHRFEGYTREQLLAWLCRMLRNNLADAGRRYVQSAKRRAARERPLDLGVGDREPLAPGLSPSADCRKQENEQLLARAIEQLPEVDRLVLQLRHREGLSFPEIASRLHRTPNAVRKLWVRAIQRLQEALAGCNVPI